MSIEEDKLNLFHKSIEEKLSDDEWNLEVVNRVLNLQRDKRKRWIQFGVLPAIIVSITTILILNNSNLNTSSDLAEKEKAEFKTTHEKNNLDEIYPDFKLHIVDTVFTPAP